MTEFARAAARGATLAALLAVATSLGGMPAQGQGQAPASAATGAPAPPATPPASLTAPPTSPRPPLGAPAAATRGEAPAQGSAKAGQDAQSQTKGGSGAESGGLFGTTEETNGLPVNVEAEQGIEWQQEKQEYIARGNAKAVRGDVTVYGQTLIAYYRKTPSGSSDVWRLDADDDVKITTPTDTAVGDKGVYDVDNGVFVLTGKKLELDTPKGVITARDTLEYWKLKQYAVARGDAKAVREDKTVTADILEAHFKPDAKGQLVISFIEAFNNVMVTNASAVAHAMYGNYNVDTSIADLKGSVKITRGQDQLNGECATMNMNTGISRLYACAKADRVRGLLIPKQGEDIGAPGKGSVAPTTKPAGGQQK